MVRFLLTQSLGPPGLRVASKQIFSIGLWGLWLIIIFAFKNVWTTHFANIRPLKSIPENVGAQYICYIENLGFFEFINGRFGEKLWFSHCWSPQTLKDLRTLSSKLEKIKGTGIRDLVQIAYRKKDKTMVGDSLWFL